MHPLFQFTLDLFAPSPTPAAQDSAALALPLPGVAASDGQTAQFRHPRANRETRLCNAVVAYEFKRAKRRTIGFAVGPEGLVVSAPKWVPLREVDAAVQEKSGWIIKKLDETRQRHSRMNAQRIDWRDGTVIPFLGQPVTVRLAPERMLRSGGAQLQAELPNPTLQVALPDTATPDQIRDSVQVWLMRQAKRLFTQRLDHFAPRLLVQWHKLSLSNARTRWGSASADGSIRLNWRLIHFRQEVIDYVVVHELSHLRVMNHSPQFWDMVRNVVPDYAVLRRQLKDESTPR
jgi:predicted metal-dependent hydrolase